MKRSKIIITASIAFALCFMHSAEITVTYADSQVIYGDCNNDGKVNVFDAIRIKKELIEGNTLDETGKLSGDMDDNLKISGFDYSALKSGLLKNYELPSEPVEKGWYSDGGNTYFINSDKLLVGENNIFGTNYYFQVDGTLKKGLYTSEDGIYFSDDYGYTQKGWFDIEGNRYFFDPTDGKAHKGDSIIEGNRYYFDNNGVLKTDWQNLKAFVDNGLAVYTYEEMRKNVYDLEKQYPGIIKVNTLATTYDGREILDVVFGNPDASKKVIIQASCHGREYMTCQVVMNQLEHNLRMYYSGTYAGRSYNDIFNDTCFHIIPMLNPDGVTISQYGAEGINNPDMRAALYSMYEYDRANGITSYNMDTYFRKWKANGRGVDINRNFDSYWTSERDIRQPGSYGYAGTGPASEIETQVIQKLVRELQGVKMVISYHSSGSYIYWAYGQQGQLRTECRNMASVVSDTTGYYLLWTDDYDSGCSNWVAGEGIISQTIEIGTGDSPLSLSELPSILNKNILVWVAVANAL